MSDAAVFVRDLHKSYGTLEAVRGIDLEVRRGEVFALLGPNGAGKTSTIEILEGYRRATSGEVSVLGADPRTGGRALRERIGIVLQATGIERFLTVEEVVELHRGYYPKPLPLDDVISLVGLEEKRTERVNRLSGGQKRRLDVALGLVGDPELLFLDEPTTGFDPTARRGAWGMISDLRSLGKTIMLTTHYMDEAQALADRVAIINEGRIIAEGPPASLAGRDRATTLIRFVKPGVPLPDPLSARARGDQVLEIRSSEPMHDLHELTGWALEHGIELAELQVTRPSLEDVYLQLTSEEQAG